MLQSLHATPEIIRESAIARLADYPEGIRQADLIAITEVEVSKKYTITEHAVKNAIWNLDEKFPDLVIKKKISHRNVIFLPTDNCIKKTNFKENFTEGLVKWPDEALNKARITILEAELTQLLRLIELGDIQTTFLVQKSNFIGLSGKEIEAVVGIKHAIEQLKKYRAYLDNFKDGI